MLTRTLAAAAIATAALANPASAAPVGCNLIVCASASMTGVNRGCAGPSPFGNYVCSYTFTYTATGSAPTPGGANWTVFYPNGGGATGGSCSWTTTGGCSSNPGASISGTYNTQWCGPQTLTASITVSASSAGLTANADNSAAVTFVPYAC